MKMYYGFTEKERLDIIEDGIKVMSLKEAEEYMWEDWWTHSFYGCVPNYLYFDCNWSEYSHCNWAAEIDVDLNDLFPDLAAIADLHPNSRGDYSDDGINGPELVYHKVPKEIEKYSNINRVSIDALLVEDVKMELIQLTKSAVICRDISPREITVISVDTDYYRNCYYQQWPTP